MAYTASIGLECHVQLKTKTKLFTGVSNHDLKAPAGSLVGPLCLGLPGSLPSLNQQAVDLAILAGLALEAEIASFSRFDRKHYFYPDLPLGYQISQHEFPIVKQALIEVKSADHDFKVRLIRAHLEADAGKLSHPEAADGSWLDLNRVGTPLLEIVSYPDITSAAHAKAFAQELALRMRYAGVSDCDMFAGNLRFDANVSLSAEPAKLGTRTEIKNLNSFRNLERAIDYEIKRQTKKLAAGEQIVQETRGWHEARQATFSQRSKEAAHDYRYMPDPDIPPLVISQAKIDQLKAQLPSSPAQIRSQLAKLKLATSVNQTIVDHPAAARLIGQLKQEPKIATIIANWLAGELLHLVTAGQLSWSQLTAAKDQLCQLAAMVSAGQLSASQAKDLLAPVVKDQAQPEQLAADQGLLQVSDKNQLNDLIDQVFQDQPQAVADARLETKAIGFLVGQVMVASGGNANPGLVADLIKQKLES